MSQCLPNVLEGQYAGRNNDQQATEFRRDGIGLLYRP